MMGYNTLIVLVGTSLLGACSGLVGSFAVLRRRALLGDALAHAAFPGVCLAFLVMGYRHLPAMLAGAFLTGIIGLLAIAGLCRGTRIKEDAAIGIVLSVFYGVGIMLSHFIQNQKTGGSRAGLNSYILGQTSGMLFSDVLLIGAAALFCLLLIVLMLKEFKVVVFDSQFAESQGWPAFFIDFALMAMIAVTVVIGLPAVGVILVAALLIMPAASARFWTDRLGVMLTIAVVIGAAMGVCGTWISFRFRWATGPSIVLAGTFIFTCSMLFSPRRGLLRQMVVESKIRRQLTEQKLLRRTFRLLQQNGFVEPIVCWSELLELRLLPANRLKTFLSRFERGGLLVTEKKTGAAADLQFRFTEFGWKQMVNAVRVDRLQERFLTEMGDATTAGKLFELDETAWEDRLPAEMLATLERSLQASGDDPRDISFGHGDGSHRSSFADGGSVR